MHPCHTYCCLLHSHSLVPSHNTLYSPFEREHVVWRHQITVAKETTLSAVPLTERKWKLFRKKKTIAGLVRVTIDMYISSIIKHNKFVICASFLHLHMSGNFLFYVLLKQQIIIKIIAMSIYVRRRHRIFKKRNNSKILNEFSGRQRDLSQKKKFCPYKESNLRPSDSALRCSLTETLRWARCITKFIWHAFCILLGLVMSIARSIEIDVDIYRKRSVYLYNSVAS